MKKFLKLNERLSRKEYFLYLFLPMVCFVILVKITTVKEPYILILVGLFFVLMPILLINSFKRGRDTGLDTFLSFFLFSILPILAPFLIFIFGFSLSWFLGMVGGLLLYLLLKSSSSEVISPLKKVERVMIYITMPILLFISLLFIAPKSTCASSKAKKDLVCVNMKGYANALEIYKSETGDYPTVKEGNDAFLKYPNNYLEKKPCDSWGGYMIYLRREKGFEIISYGADKQEGGEDEYADIFYSECK